MRKHADGVPTYDQMMLPTVAALKQLGGSGSTAEIFATVSEIMQLSDSVLEIQHGDSGITEVEYRLAWSRTYLKKTGFIDNSARGIWSLTPKASSTSINPKDIVKYVHGTRKPRSTRDKIQPESADDASENLDEALEPWTERMHKVLLTLSPAAFERLIQRLLRESGFIQVEVTGKSGDGGIDGIGIARIAGFLSFTVLFQAKRYQGSITPSQIRDFRGAMQGRTDKGLFITTGSFSRDAVKEATRDGAPPIDLIDGDELIRRLKEFRLGVEIEMVEKVTVNDAWFDTI